ncbi:glutathione S-transferase T3-like [Helianthus annuus]|uniref:glutathione S-transferase T3-like n=1 Tax=Helianthus annuus TaxID=4232 RepID=UPI000B909003|nr:glutathione S-transferase T3-like [Helianthus annuus]
MDSSWGSPPFTFSGFQQSPNAFNQMSQLQQMQQYQAFQQFMQRGSLQLDQFQSQPPTSQPQPSVHLDDDDEVVPESPPKELKRKKKKTGGRGRRLKPNPSPKKKSGSRAKPRPWTKVEEEALAISFIKASTCPIVGNNQSGSGFWKKCTERFNTLMGEGPYRDLESVSGKWRKMNKCVNDFIGIYNPLYIHRPSGTSDEDVLNLAISKWETKNPPFPHLRAWNVLKKDPKWAPIPDEVATAKRTKTSESGSYSAGGSTARCQIDIYDEPDYEEQEYHELGRPTGRDKAKKEAAAKRKGAGSSGGGGSGGGGGSKASSKMDDLISQFRSFQEFAAEKYSHKKNVSADYARAEDFRIMRLDLDSVPEEEREVYRRMKEEVKKKWTS